jgi:hypothetical protein
MGLHYALPYSRYLGLGRGGRELGTRLIKRAMADDLPT